MKLLGVVHVSNVLGTINPVEAIARAAHEAGAVVLVDASQSVPHLPVDVRAPADRMRLIVAEAGASAVLTDHAWQATARSIHSGHTIVVEVGALADESRELFRRRQQCGVE